MKISNQSRLLSIFVGLCVFVGMQVSGTFGTNHLWWWVAFVGIGVVVLDRQEVATSLLVLLGVTIGLIPIAGFLRLPPSVSSLGVVLSIYVAVKFAAVSHCDVFRKLGGSLMVVSPAVGGGVFTYWWWSDLLTGSKEDILTRLMPQWDLSTHFLFFSSMVRDGRYLALSSPPTSQYSWVGREYPAGIHYLWSQLALPLRDASQIDKSALIPFFAHAIVVTAALAVGAISLSLARLGNTTTSRFIGGLIGAAIGITQFCAGPVSAAIFGGFANVSAAVTGMAVLVSFLLKPHNKSRNQLWIITLGIWVLVYNWFPLAGLFLPAVIVSLMKVIRLGQRRHVLNYMIMCLAGSLPPVAFSLSLGVQHLQGAGGVPALPHYILIAGSVVAVGIAFVPNRSLTLETRLLLATPAILLFCLGRYLYSTTGELRYYFAKFGLFVVSYLVLIFGGLLIQRLQNYIESAPSSVQVRSRVTVGVSMLSIGVSQIFGYWGPELNGLGEEVIGSKARSEIREVSTKLSDFAPLSRVVVRESIKNRDRSTSEKACMLLVLPREIATDAAFREELTFGITDPQNALKLANVWFRTMSDSAYQETWKYVYKLNPGEWLDSWTIVANLNDSDDHMDMKRSICILSSKPVVTALKKSSPEWQTFEIGS